MLIPISLDLTIENQRIKDIFLWDTNEKTIKPSYFAEIYVEENNLNSLFEELIEKEIQKQMSFYLNNVILPFLEIRKKIISKQKIHEMIVVINLDIRVKDRVFKDKFMWDLFNLDNLNSTEKFIFGLMKDLNFPKKFSPIINFELMKQLLSKMEDCVKKGYSYFEKSTSSITNVSEKKNSDIFRNNFESINWQPTLEKMDFFDYKKMNANIEREERALKRRNESVLIQPSLMKD